MWAYCEIVGNIQIRIKKERETIIVLCASCGFWRGDLVSTPQMKKEPSCQPSAIPAPSAKSAFVEGNLRALLEGLPAVIVAYDLLFKPQPQLKIDAYIEVIHYLAQKYSTHRGYNRRFSVSQCRLTCKYMKPWLCEQR